MNGNLVSFADYGGLVGAPYTADAMRLMGQLLNDAEIRKALEATGSLPPSGPGVDAARVYDLSATLASAEYEEPEIVRWKSMRKIPVTQLVHEFARMDSYASGYRPGFISRTSAGTVGDPVFARGLAEVKFVGDKYEADLPTQLITAIGFNGTGQNVMETNRMAATRRLLRTIERELYFGDTRVSTLFWKGLIQQIGEVATAQNSCVINMNGGYLNEYVLRQAAAVASLNHSTISDFDLPVQGNLDLQLALFPSIRRDDGRIGAVGIHYKEILAATLGGTPGSFTLNVIPFLSPGIAGGFPRTAASAAMPNSPVAPTSVSGVAAAHTATNTAPGLRAGTYVYGVSAVGEDGESLATASSAVVATAGQKITLTITCSDERALFFIVYRNEAGVSGSTAANRLYLTRVNRAAGAITTTFVDDGSCLVNTYTALALNNSSGKIAFLQLLPLMGRDLPQAYMTNQKGILMFGTPVMYEPTKNLVLRNIGMANPLEYPATNAIPA